MSTIKLIDKTTIEHAASEAGAVVTAEYVKMLRLYKDARILTDAQLTC